MTLKTILGTSLTVLMLASAAQAHEGGYVTNSAGEAVKNSAGECVKAAYANPVDGCEAAPPAPVPAPAPAVAPTPRRAPPAPVVPKVKAKGNYKGAVQMDPASRATMQNYQR